MFKIYILVMSFLAEIFWTESSWAEKHKLAEKYSNEIPISNDRNKRARMEVHLSWFRPFSAQTAFDPIIFGPFEYSAQTVKVHY
jgi:hypothetical protein